jgi:general secretion pathway protein D
MKTSAALSASKVALAIAGVAVTGAVRGQTINSQPGVSAITPETQQVETGPVLDVVPYVLSDGFTINLALIPSLTDFNGYDTAPLIPNVTGALNVVQLPVVLPDFTVRQVVTTVNVWDNQTVVLGGLISSSVQSTKDKVPFLGDIPLLGKLFQSESKTSTKKNLMIFVTSTLVDPAGNRVHSDDDLPFAQTQIPAQPPVAGQEFKPNMPQAAPTVQPIQ